MRSTSKKHFRRLAAIVFALGVMTASSFAQTGQEEKRSEGRFCLTSTMFENDTVLPISAIHNVIVNNKNVCSIDGSPGGNQSPELSWSDAPPRTRTFVVTTYDVTAAFTHWGMYNIPGDSTGLPENAGVAGSAFGAQIVNDFFMGAEYDGPCPPPNLEPFVHHYVFTVYALDVELELPSSANFPANAETLYQALIEAGRERHILATATLTGLYSTNSSAH